MDTIDLSRPTDEAVFAAMEPREPGDFANHATPLIRNCWYACARAGEIGRTPLARKLLGVDVALFRTEAGAPVAMRNRCPHRSFPLARGKLSGDRLVCGYHGMEFGPDGVCAHMPALSQTPATATVQTFPVVDRGPLTWICLTLRIVPPGISPASCRSRAISITIMLPCRAVSGSTRM